MKKNYSEWTKWDWFVDDVKYHLSDPTTWLLILLGLITVGIVIFTIIVLVHGNANTNEHSTTFWTIYNMNTTIRNMNTTMRSTGLY